MPDTAASVNEKLYHAGILWNLACETDAGGIDSAARKKALSDAAFDSANRALVHFLNEIAESCLIREPVTSLDNLASSLSRDGRSHAVVETLLQLDQQTGSWLDYFINQQTSLQANTESSSNNLASDITSDDEFLSKLAEFRQFVTTQRDFLQEW